LILIELDTIKWSPKKVKIELATVLIIRNNVTGGAKEEFRQSHRQERMRDRIRRKIDSARSGAISVQAFDVGPKGVLVLNTDLAVQQGINDVWAGDLLTLKEVAEKLKVSKETVRRLFQREPGVLRVKSEYRIPQSVFERVALRCMRDQFNS
jgi:AraC-like DNA-binding protein